MSGGPDRRAGGSAPGQDAEHPIVELADLREQPSPGFLARIRGSIDRRRLGSDLAELGWKGLVAVLVEFIDFALQLVGGRPTDNKRR